MTSIKDCNLALIPRIYQKHAYDLMLKNYKEKNDHTFHIVAPPGSGKTILGLLLLLKLKEKTFILSPNRTIANQWEEKFKSFAVDTINNKDCTKLISSDIKNNPEILTTTYQTFSVKDKNGKLHKNAEELIKYLINNKFKTIVLDECHHLLNYWAEIIKIFIKKAPYRVVVIGLTATPPKDKSNKEKQVYLEIMGEVDYQVPIPAVVKDGNLAPFRDLPYFVTPTDSELSFLNKETNAIYTLINEINELSKSLILDYNLTEYTELFIKNPLYESTPISFNEYYLKEPDIAIAMIKYILHQDLSIPVEIIVQDEMLEDISIYDYACLFRAYYYDYIINIQMSEQNNARNTEPTSCKQQAEIAKLKEMILKTWKKLGFNLHKNRVIEIKNNISNILQVSNAKIKAVETILENEFRILAKELKGLVLTDFIEAHNKKSLKKIIDPSLGGASGVFIHISNTKLYNELKPIMITGKKMMIHKELKNEFIKFNLNFQEKENYLLLENPSNTTELLEHITNLTSTDKTRLLIGTRSLLGEGYDNVRINTLIDLTVTSSFVSVNQIRGRALRKDPCRADKVANIWEIITIIPNIETGYYDLKRVKKKHEQFLSLSPSGLIERGISHLGLEKEKLEHIEIINQNSLELAKKRGDTYVDWKIGEKYRDNFVQKIEFNTKEISSRKIKRNSSKNEKKESKKNTNYFTKTTSKHYILRSILFADIMMLVASIFTFHLTDFINFKSGSAEFFIFLILLLISGTKLLRKTFNKENFIRKTVEVIFYSFIDLGLINKNEEIENIIEINESKDKFSILVKKEEISEIFITSINQIFKPIFYQKYVIEYINLYNNKDIRYFPVPDYFAKNKTLANTYLKHWNNIILDGELVYIKNEKNYNKIKKYLIKKPIDVSGKSRELWM